MYGRSGRSRAPVSYEETVADIIISPSDPLPPVQRQEKKYVLKNAGDSLSANAPSTVQQSSSVRRSRGKTPVSPSVKEHFKVLISDHLDHHFS